MGKTMDKLVILGTNYFAVHLAVKAKQLGYETHMFGINPPPIAYVGNLCDDLALAACKYADFSYKLSVVTEQDEILEVCKKIKPAGIMSIAMDTTIPCMCYLSSKLGLSSNSTQSAFLSTNKHAMKKRFKERKVGTADFIISDYNPPSSLPFPYPVIVKSIDRAGKIGITKVDAPEQLEEAIKYGIMASQKSEVVLIEEFVIGKEYTVEAVSYNGKHHILTYTEKWSDAPHFVEEMHLQPALISDELKSRISSVVYAALDALEINKGPSHTELRITKSGEIKVIEVAARVVADAIWDLVELTTGIDWIKSAIDVAVGKEPDLSMYENKNICAATKFIMTKEDHVRFEWLKKEHKEKIHSTSYVIEPYDDREIITNGQRYGYYILKCSSRDEAIQLTQPHAMV